MEEVYSVRLLLEGFGLCLRTAVRHGQKSDFEYFTME